MKHNFQELRNILYHPIYETRVKNAKKWLDKATKELEQLKQSKADLGEWIRLHSGVKTSGELLERFIDEVLGAK